MAEVAMSGGSHKGGAPKQRKKSTRIDMTAMVDVAFLLLTFFILTTTLATPQAMQLTLPAEGDHSEVKQEKVLTLYLGENDQVHGCFFLAGDNEPTIETTDFSSGGLRAMVQQHMHRMPVRCPEGATAPEIKAARCWDPIIVLKPTVHCSYRNVVDALDEMRINQVSKYALAEVEALDSMLLAERNLR